MKAFFGISFGVMALACILGIITVVTRGCEFAGQWLGDAQKTVYQEVNPQELLRKYTWFKDALATIDSRDANITVYKQRLLGMQNDYKNKPRSDWDRTDKEQFNQWNSEVSGLIAARNKLASEYNAQMSKANWAFTNAGSLPQGAQQVLPREVREYILEY